MRDSNRLTARTVATKKKPGRYGDGGGLWLQVSKFDTKSWVYRFMLDGRARHMGLGPVDLVSLAEAREARTIDHAMGHGLSRLSCFWAFDARDTVKPSLTSPAASARLSGVIRLAAPSSSSGPHRPQFDSSVCHRSYRAAVTSGSDVSGSCAADGKLVTQASAARSPIEYASLANVVIVGAPFR